MGFLIYTNIEVYRHEGAKIEIWIAIDWLCPYGHSTFCWPLSVMGICSYICHDFCIGESVGEYFVQSASIYFVGKIWICGKNITNLSKPQCQGLRQTLFLQGSTFDSSRTYFLQTLLTQGHFSTYHLWGGGLSAETCLALSLALWFRQINYVFSTD